MIVNRERRGYAKIVGGVVRDARKKAGVSTEELARRAGMCRTYPSKIEQGHRGLSVLYLIKISKGLRISSQTMIRRIEKALG